MTWGFMGRTPSTRLSRAARSNRSLRCGPSTASSNDGGPWTARNAPVGPAPPPGWHLPEVASKRRELDSFDVVEGLVIKGGPQVEVLNGISLHGGLAASWPVEATVTAKVVVESLSEHWRAFGLPGYFYCIARLTDCNLFIHNWFRSPDPSPGRSPWSCDMRSGSGR